VLGTLHTTSATKTIDRIIRCLAHGRARANEKLSVEQPHRGHHPDFAETPDQARTARVCEVMVLTRRSQAHHDRPNAPDSSQLANGQGVWDAVMDQALLAAINAKEVDPEHAYSYAPTSASSSAS